MAEDNDTHDIMDWSSPSPPRDPLLWTELPSLRPIEEWPVSPNTTSTLLLSCTLSVDVGSVGILEPSQGRGDSRHLASSDRLRVDLCHDKRRYQDSAVGFLLRFPRKNGGIKANGSRSHSVFIGLPPGGFTWHTRGAANPSDDHEPVSELLIKLLPDASLDVCGFGLPFEGVDEEVDGWINQDEPINGSVRLSTILMSKEFIVSASTSSAGLQSFVANCLKATRG